MACSNQINGLSIILNITYIGSNRFIYVGFRFLLNVLYFHLEKKSTCLVYYTLKTWLLKYRSGSGESGSIFPFCYFKVFISGTKSECKKVLETILKNRRLCSLLSPFFTPNAAPTEFIQLYEKVVKFLSEDNSDVIFMLLTKVRWYHWNVDTVVVSHSSNERCSGVWFPRRP